MSLLHKSTTLDFMESSNWPITFLDIWDFVGANFPYPDVRILEVSWDLAQSPKTAVAYEEVEGGRPWFILDLGNHPSLGREVKSFWSEAFGDTPEFQNLGCAGLPDGSSADRHSWIFNSGSNGERLHPSASSWPLADGPLCIQPFHLGSEGAMPQYGGASENYKHPFSRDCSPDCEFQQEALPYVMPILTEMARVRDQFYLLVQRKFLASSFYNGRVMIMCSTPSYACSLLHGLEGVPILGYFGLPLLYFTPAESKQQVEWLSKFQDMATSPNVYFLTNNPITQAQILYQTGIALPIIRPNCLYLEGASYAPVRMGPREILLPEPRYMPVFEQTQKYTKS